MTNSRLALVIEDEEALAGVMQKLLSKAGFRTVHANDTESAMRALASERPAVVTLDLSLKDGLSGPALARHLAHLGVPFIVCSADPMANRLVPELPATAFVRKPFAAPALIHAVYEAMGDR